MTRGSGVREGNYASFKGSRSQRHPAVNQELTFSSLQTSNGVGEGGEPGKDLPPVDEATILPSQPSDLQERSEPKRKGLRSTVVKRNVERPVETEKAKPPARSCLASTAPKGRKRNQPKRRNKIESAVRIAPSISPCLPPTGSVHCDKPNEGSAGSQISKSHLGLCSLHPGPATTVRPEAKNSDLIWIPRLGKPDSQSHRRCSSEPPLPLRVAIVHQGCRLSSTSIPAEALSRDVANRPETRSWARHLPTPAVEASSPRTGRLPAVPSSAQDSSWMLGNQCSRDFPHQKMSKPEGLTLVTAVVEPTEAHPKPGGVPSGYLKPTGQHRLVVGKGILRPKEVQMPSHSSWEASNCMPTSEDYDTMKRNLVASENTYKRLSAAYEEFHKNNTIAQQRASNAESELKRLKKQLNRLQKENTEYKANRNRVKRQAKQKNQQAAVGPQQKSPIALGPQGEFDNVQIDLQRPDISTTTKPSRISHCESPLQSPFVGACIGAPVSVVNTKEPCIPEMEGFDACGGQTDLNDFGELGKGLDDLDWGDIDPMEFEMACNSMFEDMP